jgi:polar amino acid transport system substrate-binding protein
MRPACLVLVTLLWLAGMRAWADDVPRTLQVCDDVAEYPPFSYLQRENGHKTTMVVGYSVDYVRRILAASGRDATIELLPWRRCVEQVRAGAIDFALSAVSTAERGRDFVFTPPYFTLSPTLFFIRARAPQALRNVSDLASLKLCGQFGYTYAEFGVPETLIDRGAKTLEAAANMLRAGRCDVFLGDAEIVAGEGRVTGRPVFPDPEFASRAAPEAAPEPMAMMIGKALPFRDALLDLLTRGVRDMQASGAAKRLSDRYLGPASP